MKALTLWQPWASAIALGVKTVETRSWSTHYRGPLAIHAALRRVTAAERELVASVHAEAEADRWRAFTGQPVRSPLKSPGHVSRLPYGVVVAVCELRDVVPTGRESLCVTAAEAEWGDFSTGRFAWLLGDIRPLDPPVPAKGGRGLWDWDTMFAIAASTQLTFKVSR